MICISAQGGKTMVGYKLMPYPVRLLSPRSSIAINMLTSIATAVALLAANAAAKIYYAGVAESGGEFGVWSNTATPGTGLPGRFGVDYEFINKSAIDVYVDQNKVRNCGRRGVRKDLMITDQSLPSCFPPGAHVSHRIWLRGEVQ